MSTTSLTAWGILRPDDVVRIAAVTGLELAAACALLEQESGGGRNVWGSDGVPTGGAYVKGEPVDEASYRAYRAALASGRAGQQGCGPTQLTSVTYQDRADAAGGCWDPVANMCVGFALLATYARQWGIEAAFRAYNGGPGNRTLGRNANADRYARQAMDRYRRWLDRLGHAPPQEDDMPLTQADADLVARTLLAVPLRDLYPDDPSVPPRTLTVGDTLAWAAANAGRALTATVRLRDRIEQLAQTGQAPVDVLHDELLDALEALGPLTLIPTRKE